MKKVLFIDRDGTLVIEPPIDYQLDNFSKLEFYPQAIQYMVKIAQLGYELVMVTNQDGLGTNSFPEETFWPVQDFIVRTFKNEGVIFNDIHIDKSFPKDNAPTRKPRTGLLTKYIDSPDYDLAHSYVLGDRITDIELAKNLGAKGILVDTNNENISPSIKPHLVLQTNSWQEIYTYLLSHHRQSSVYRKTHETKIDIALDLDGTGDANINTGLAFFDHMLDQICRHGQVDMNIEVLGDLQVDEHHTIEDTAIALGTAFRESLGNKLGIERYGFSLPMDDCQAHVAIDFGGRSWLVWKTKFAREKIGDMPTEMFEHFFKSFCDGAQANLYIKAKGKNEHHKIEAIFKAFSKAIKMAIKQDKNKLILPSTKGML